MRIFHLGDLHIGKSVNQFCMLEDQRFVLQQLYQMIEEEGPDVVVIAGDLFDRAVPAVDAVELVDELFKKVVIERETPIIAIAGNHDSSERIEYLSKFAQHNGLYLRGVLKKEITPISLKDAYGEVIFYPIPYAKPAVIRELYQDQSIKNHDDGMKKVIEQIKQSIDPKKRNIAIAHGHVTNINEDGVEQLEESKSEKPLEIGGTDSVNAVYFDCFNYTALGHLHGPQKVKDDRIRYSGSLLKYSFSEVNQRKGITIVDLDKKGDVTVRICDFKPRRNMRILKGKINDILTGKQEDTGSKEDYIRIELEDRGEILDPMSKLRSVYPHVMELGRSEDQHTKSKETKVGIANVKEQDKLKLFEGFYEDIIGKKCEEEKLLVMKKVIEQIESEDER